MVYDTYNHSIHGVYKPTYNGGGKIARNMEIKLIKPMKYQKIIHILGMKIWRSMYFYDRTDKTYEIPSGKHTKDYWELP